jgi:hypothetical protein
MAESFIAEFDDQEVKKFLRAVDKNLKNIRVREDKLRFFLFLSS